MGPWKPVRLSAMHHRHLELGAVMVEDDGWQQPARYRAVEQELEDVKKGVGLGDISPKGKASLQGSMLDSILDDITSGVMPLKLGSVREHLIRNGSNRQPVVLARLADDEIMIVTEPNQTSLVSQLIEGYEGRGAYVVDLTSGLAGVTITGPAGHMLLSGVTELDVSHESFSNMSCAQIKVAEVHGVLLRLDLGGLPSYELYFGREFGEYVWDALFEAGEQYGVMPLGLETIVCLQVEH